MEAMDHAREGADAVPQIRRESNCTLILDMAIV